jgi:hypothetical protein
LITICGLVSEALTCIIGENARLATNREEPVCIGAIVLEKSVVEQIQLVANIRGDLPDTNWY